MIVYLWSNLRRSTLSLERQHEMDLRHALETASSDAELLQQLQALPVAVVKAYQDETGHTVLHRVIRSASRRQSSGASSTHPPPFDDDGDSECTRDSIHPSTEKSKSSSSGFGSGISNGTTTTTTSTSTSTSGRWSFRSKPESKDTTTTSSSRFRRRRHPYADGLDVLQYLVHCTDPQLDDDSDIAHVDTLHRTSCYNSLVRVRSAGGSLPLHLACRYWDTNGVHTPNDTLDPSAVSSVLESVSSSFYTNDSRMLDAVSYLVQTYPQSVQCPDAWGHLPLHEACVNPSKPPLDVIVFLVQQWPHAVRTVTHDGNVPLHLAAAATACVDDDNAKDARTTTVAANNSTGTATESPKSTTIVPTELDDELCGMSPPVQARHEHFQQRQLELVQYLVDYWPDAVHQTNRLGQTPLQCAISGADSSSCPSPSNRLVVEFLQSFGEPDCAPSSRALRTSGNPFDDDHILEDDEATDAITDTAPPDQPVPVPPRLVAPATNPFDNEGVVDAGDGMTMKGSPLVELQSPAPNPFADADVVDTWSDKMVNSPEPLPVTNPFEEEELVGVAVTVNRQNLSSSRSLDIVVSGTNFVPSPELASESSSGGNPDDLPVHQQQETTPSEINTKPLEDKS